MTRLQLSETDHARISSAVAAAESGSDAEIVTVISARSDAYHDAALHYAVGAVLLFLGAIAIIPDFFITIGRKLAGGWDDGMAAQEQLLMQLGGAIVVFLSVRYLLAWKALRMAVTPRSTKRRRVRRRAVTLFRALAEGRTRRKTGVLLYISLAEHQVELVADATISTTVAPEQWGGTMAELLDYIRAGRPGDGMVAAIGQIGSLLATHIPRSADDVDELPNRLIEL